MNEIRPIGLTLSAQTLYSISRRNIMPAVVQTETTKPGVLSRGGDRASRVQERGGTVSVDRPRTADELIEHLAGGRVREPGKETRPDSERVRVEKAFREKFSNKYDQAGNASLGDVDRLGVAKTLLGIPNFKPGQEEALLKAHYAEGARKKVEALHRGGFTPEQTRTLIESHLAGMSPATAPDVSPEYDSQIQAKIAEIASVTFTDPELGNFARKIGDLYRADYIDRDMLFEFYKNIRKHAVEGGDLAKIGEAKVLQDAISKIIQNDDLRTGRVDRRDYSNYISNYFDLDEKVKAAELIDPKSREAIDLREDRKVFVRKIANDINLQTQGDYDALFKIIIEEGGSLEYLINRIVSAPLDSETGDWDLGFYGNINLNTITNILRTQKDNAVDQTTRDKRNIEYQSALEIEEAIRLAHEVNKSIINTDLAVFGKIAGSLTDGMLARLSKVKGVGVVGRLLEAEHGSLVARDTWINSKNYAVMMGKTKDPESGLLSEHQERSAIESFRDLVRKAKERADSDPD
ncbi:MAG: hypothetical protein AAB520_01715, partial [Patescibacteria group bacterium]